MSRPCPRFRTCTVLAALACLPVTLAGSDPSIQPRQRAAASAEPQNDTDFIQGFTEPYADIELAAAEMGTLSEVQVREGDQVTAGQLLAKLDDRVLRASLAAAEAGMNAEGELQSAETQLRLKKVEQKKLQELFARNHASRQELDRINGEVDVAHARLQSVREDLEVRRLEHARIQAQLQQREIRSTIDGVVVNVKKDRGEFVSPSDPVVARVVQLDPLLIVFSVPNEKRSLVSSGQTVRMHMGRTSSEVQGEVEFVSPTADASSGSFRVKVRMPNPDGRWHGGEKTILLLDGTSAQPPAQRIAKNQK